MERESSVFSNLIKQLDVKATSVLKHKTILCKILVDFFFFEYQKTILFSNNMAKLCLFKQNKQTPTSHHNLKVIKVQSQREGILAAGENTMVYNIGIINGKMNNESN